MNTGFEEVFNTKYINKGISKPTTMIVFWGRDLSYIGRTKVLSDEVSQLNQMQNGQCVRIIVPFSLSA